MKELLTTFPPGLTLFLLLLPTLGFLFALLDFPLPFRGLLPPRKGLFEGRKALLILMHRRFVVVQVD